MRKQFTLKPSRLVGLDLTGLSDRSIAALRRGVSGGDGEPTLADLIEEASHAVDLDDERIGSLAEDLRAEALALIEARADGWLEAAQEAETAIEALGGIAAERIAAVEAENAQADELIARLSAADGGDDPDPDPEAEPEPEADPEAETDPEAEADPEAETDPAPEAEEPAERIAASRTRITRVEARRPASMRPRKRTASAGTPQPLKLTASANVPGVQAGMPLDTPEKIAHAFAGALRTMDGYRGPREPVPVMSLGVWDPAEVYGEERTLRHDARANEGKLHAVTGIKAIKAAGGVCVAPPLDYTQPVLGTEDRPVWNEMLTRFGADRAGIRTLPVPTLAEVTGAVGAWTQDNDADPSDPATKPCLVMTCPDEITGLVEAITRCITVGNFRARFWGEQVQAVVEKVAVYAARFAESRHLTQIGSHAVTKQLHVEQNLGTTRDILTGLDRLSAQMRNYYRLDPDFPLRFGMPAWLLDNMISDLAREQPGSTAERLATSDAQLASFFAARQINPTFFLDGEAGQVFGAQPDSGLALKWPSSVVTYLYPEGFWLGLDGGSIDFGLYRDSVLNSTNDAQMFSEVFQGVHPHGDGACYRVLFDICADGTTAAPIETDLCDTGS